MQEELNQFEHQKVWKLVPRPQNRKVIDTRWVFRNKLDEEGTVTRNKARLVAKGFSKLKGSIMMKPLHQLLGWRLSECS